MIPSPGYHVIHESHPIIVSSKNDPQGKLAVIESYAKFFSSKIVPHGKHVILESRATIVSFEWSLVENMRNVKLILLSQLSFYMIKG